jgi:hypothetical protein
MLLQKATTQLDTVILTCNPSDPGGGDWEDCGLRPVWVKSSQDSTSTTAKIGCGGTHL